MTEEQNTTPEMEIPAMEIPAVAEAVVETPVETVAEAAPVVEVAAVETPRETTSAAPENPVAEVKTVRKFASGRAPEAPRVAGGRPAAGGRGGDRGGKGGPKRAGGRPERVKPEFEQKTIDVRRVTRVVSGGRRFTFSVALVIGDRNGKVGFGMGKAGDTALAIDKAYKQAQKKMVELSLTKEKSIPYELAAKFNASNIILKPNKGRGLIAGSSARVVLAMAGVENITAKIHSGSKNKINNAKVAMKALAEISSPYEKKAAAPGAEKAMGESREGARPRAPRATVNGAPRKAFFVKKKVDTENAEAPKAEIVFEK